MNNRAGKSAFICERAREEGFRNQGKFEEGDRRKINESPTIIGEEKAQKYLKILSGRIVVL